MLLSWKNTSSHDFLQFLPSSEAKNASRMSLGCLSEASKMPSWRDSQAAERSVYDRRSLSCRRQHVGLQGLKGSVFAMFSWRKPLEIGSDSKETRVKISYRKKWVVRPYNLTSLQPYIITFSFSTSPFRPFGLSQSSKQHLQKRSKVWRRRGFPFVERTKKMTWEVFSKS